MKLEFRMNYREFYDSLNPSDITTTWKRTRAGRDPGEDRILGKGELMLQDWPFKLLGATPMTPITSPSLSTITFLWCCDRYNLGFTPNRPYKNNDNAHIEQEN